METLEFSRTYDILFFSLSFFNRELLVGNRLQRFVLNTVIRIIRIITQIDKIL